MHMKRTENRSDGYLETWCPVCRETVPEGALQECIICRSLFCQRCAVAAYGHVFCSTRCKDYFFYGDGEEFEEEA